MPHSHVRSIHCQFRYDKECGYDVLCCWSFPCQAVTVKVPAVEVYCNTSYYVLVQSISETNLTNVTRLCYSLDKNVDNIEFHHVVTKTIKRINGIWLYIYIQYLSTYLIKRQLLKQLLNTIGCVLYGCIKNSKVIMKSIELKL